MIDIEWRLLRIWETIRLIGVIIFCVFIIGYAVWVLSWGWIGLFLILVIVGGMILGGWLIEKLEEMENWTEKDLKEKFGLESKIEISPPGWLDWKIKNWENNSKEIERIKELCQIRHRYGEDSPEFEYHLDKQTKICRRPRTSGTAYFDSYGSKAGVTNFAESIGLAKHKLRRAVNINYESWCKKYAEQYTQNSRADKKGKGKMFEEE